MQNREENGVLTTHLLWKQSSKVAWDHSAPGMGYLHLPAHSCKFAFHSPRQQGPPELALTPSSLHGSWVNKWSWNMKKKKGRGTPGGHTCLLRASCKVRESHTCERRTDCVWRPDADEGVMQSCSALCSAQQRWHYQSILHLRELSSLNPPGNRQQESTALFYRWDNSPRADIRFLCRHNEIHWLAGSTPNLPALSP